MKIGNLVYLNGTNREVSGIVIETYGDSIHVVWHGGITSKVSSWERANWLEVFYESR